MDTFEQGNFYGRGRGRDHEIGRGRGHSHIYERIYLSPEMIILNKSRNTKAHVIDVA